MNLKPPSENSITYRVTSKYNVIFLHLLCVRGQRSWFTCSFPFAFFKKSSTASTACWKRFPLFILIISSLWAWYGFSCSTLIQALETHRHTTLPYQLEKAQHAWPEQEAGDPYLLVLCSKELHKVAFLAPGLFQVLGGAHYLKRECFGVSVIFLI